MKGFETGRTVTTGTGESLIGCGEPDASAPTMSMECEGDRNLILGEALQRIGDTRAQSGGRRWLLRAERGQRPVEVELEDHWLSLCLPMRPFSADLDCKSIGGVLRRNGRLAGSARITGQGLGRQRHLVIDIPAEVLPWDSPSELRALLAGALLELRYATARKQDSHDPVRASSLSGEKMKTLCDESGWPARSEDRDELEITLDVPGQYLTARLTRLPGVVRLRLVLFRGRLASAGPSGAAAVTALLWLVTCRLRLAKAVFPGNELAVEVVLPEVFTSEASLAHAFAALSIAARQVLPAAQLLITDERLAQIYLSNMGLFPAR